MVPVTAKERDIGYKKTVRKNVSPQASWSMRTASSSPASRTAPQTQCEKQHVGKVLPKPHVESL